MKKTKFLIGTLALLATTILFGAGSVKAYDFGTGKATIENTQKMPYSATCYVVSTWPDGSTSCGTGFMVGKKKVLTAGHCVYDGLSGGWATSMTVSPGAYGQYADITPYGTVNAVRWFTSNEWIVNSNINGTGGDHSADYGIIILNKNIGNKTGWFTMRKYTDYKRTYNISFYLGSTPQYFSSGKTLGRYTSNGLSGIAGHYITSGPGSSGAPIWYKDKKNGKYYAVGMQTAESYGYYVGTNNLFNMGTYITKPLIRKIWSLTKNTDTF